MPIDGANNADVFVEDLVPAAARDLKIRVARFRIAIVGSLRTVSR